MEENDNIQEASRPHQVIINFNATVCPEMSINDRKSGKGMVNHPVSAHSESFAFLMDAKDEVDGMNILKQMLEEVKEKWNSKTFNHQKLENLENLE